MTKKHLQRTHTSTGNDDCSMQKKEKEMLKREKMSHAFLHASSRRSIPLFHVRQIHRRCRRQDVEMGFIS